MSCIYSFFCAPIACSVPDSIRTRADHLQTAGKLGYFMMKDLCLGATLGLCSLFTLGIKRNISCFAKGCLRSVGLNMPDLYLELLRTINPEAKIFTDSSNPLFGASYLANSLLIQMNEKGYRCSQSQNFLEKQLISRGYYACLILSSLVTAATRASIGLTAMLFSFLTAGYFPYLNSMAYQGLCFPLLLRDLLHGSLNLLNPGSLKCWADSTSEVVY